VVEATAIEVSVPSDILPYRITGQAARLEYASSMIAHPVGGVLVNVLVLPVSDVIKASRRSPDANSGIGAVIPASVVTPS
jgi:hypothetical protein